jgi:heme exporter protein CcmD
VATVRNGTRLCLTFFDPALNFNAQRNCSPKVAPSAHDRNWKALMDLSAAHANIVVASYALTALCIIGIILQIVLRDRKLAQKLKDLKPD